MALGCFGADIPDNTSTVDYWNSECADGLIHQTPEQWAAIVRAAYAGYGNGWRPKMQVFHGTADETLNYTNLGEEIKEWTGVFGLSQEPTRTFLDTPLANWTKWVYGDLEEDAWFEAYSAWNVSHNIPVQEDVVLGFFDLTCTGVDCFHWGQGGPGGRE